MRIKHHNLYFAIFLLLLPISYARIDLSGISHEYSYGDTLTVHILVEYSEKLTGFFKLRLVCNGRTQDIFLSPLQLRSHEAYSLDSIPFVIESDYGSSCSVLGFLTDSKGNDIEDVRSDNFALTSSLDFSLQTDKDTYEPGETLHLIIDFYGTQNNTPWQINAILNKKIYSFRDKHPGDELTFKIPSTLQGGKYSLVVEIEDSLSNRDQRSSTISISTTLSKVFLSIQQFNFTPSETLNFKPVLYDSQGNILDKAMLEITLRDPSGRQVLATNTRSTQRVNFNFTQQHYDGRYTLIAEYQNLSYSVELYLQNPQMPYEAADNPSGVDEESSLDSVETESIDSETPAKVNMDKNKGISFSFIFTLIIAIFIVAVIGYFLYIKQKKKGDKIFGGKF